MTAHAQSHPSTILADLQSATTPFILAIHQPRSASSTALPACPIATIRSHHLRPRAQFAIAPVHRRVPHPPRFPALALFRRRPPARVDSLGIPASENLHRAQERTCRRGRSPISRQSAVSFTCAPPLNDSNSRALHVCCETKTGQGMIDDNQNIVVVVPSLTAGAMSTSNMSRWRGHRQIKVSWLPESRKGWPESMMGP
jgi:hypothetical protein